MAEQRNRIVEFTLRHNPAKRSVRFRLVCLDEQDRVVTYRGRGRYDPDDQPTATLELSRLPAMYEGWPFPKCVAAPVEVSVAVGSGRLVVDPDRPVVRTVKAATSHD